MDFTFVTKIVCDLCMWFGATGFVLSLFGTVGVGLEPLAVLTVGSALATVLKKPPLRFLPVPILLLCGLWIRGFEDCLLVIPPCLYCIYLCVSGPRTTDYSQCRKYITVIAPAGLFIMLIIVVCGGMSLLTRTVLPYYTIFLVFGVLTLSISRHEEHKRNERRLWILITASLAGCCAAALLFSSSWFFSVAGGVLSFVYNSVISVIVMGFVYLFTGFMWLIASIFNIESLKEQFANREVAQMTGEPPENAEEILEMAERPELVGQIAIALGVIALVIFAIVLFRYLSRREQVRVKDSDGVQDVRSKLSVTNSGEPAGQRLSRSPRQMVRRYYRKFLSKAQSAGVDLRPGTTSAGVARMARAYYDAELLEGLRDIYIVARYSTQEITKADARMAKTIYSKLKQKQ